MIWTFGAEQKAFLQRSFRASSLLITIICGGLPQLVTSSLDIKKSMSSCELRSEPPCSSKLLVRTSETIMVEKRRLTKSSNEPIIENLLIFLPRSQTRFSQMTFLMSRACVLRGDIMAMLSKSSPFLNAMRQSATWFASAQFSNDSFLTYSVLSEELTKVIWGERGFAGVSCANYLDLRLLGLVEIEG